MIIAKVLNNNTVVAIDERGEDVVVLGRGIAFGKKRGDLIDEADVSRVFSQQAPEETRRIIELLSDLPEGYIDAATRIVESAKVQLGREFEGNLYFALADHLHYTIERARQGMLIQNRLLLEIKIIYKEEYAAASSAVAYLNQRFDVELPDDEAAFIALHFVNATLGATMQDTYEIAEIVRDIYAIIRNWLTATIDEESLSWYRLMVHVKFFAQRMVMKQPDAPTQDDWLINLVREQYPSSLACAERIAAFIQQKHHYRVPDSEKAYLAIHIEHVTQGLQTEKTKTERAQNTKAPAEPTEGTDEHGDVR